MFLERITRNAELGYNPINRRQFIETVAVVLGSIAYTSKNSVAYAAKDDRDLTARILAFRKIKDYPTVFEYARELKIELLTADPDISNFLRQPDIVEHIKQVSFLNDIPSYLLAAIVAEERTPTGVLDKLFHGTIERWKSKYGLDTSIGVANVKMSIGAYYLFGIKPKKEEFDKLSEEQKSIVVRYLEDPKNNLEIAARFLGYLKNKFLEWNELNMASSQKITEAEFDANPLALLRVANAYSGGEDRLDRPVSDKAKRVISILVGNKFIWDLYQGDNYNEKYRKLKDKKEAQLLYTSKLEEVKSIMSKGIDLMNKNSFSKGYDLLNKAKETAYRYALDADTKERKITFLAYAAYAEAENGFLLRIANEHKVKVFEDGIGQQSYFGNNVMARLRYRNALSIYDTLKDLGADAQQLSVNPKPGWEKKLPSRKNIQKVLSQIETEIVPPKKLTKAKPK